MPVVLAALAAAALAGCASVVTNAARAGRAAGREIPAAGGVVQLAGYSSSDGPRSTVILTGAIGDFGDALSVDLSGRIGPDYKGELRLLLTRGSFRLGIAGVDRKIVGQFRHFPPNRRTCSGTVIATGSTPIVAGSGTGAYEGISGNFETTVTIAEVDARSNAPCDASSAYLAEAIFTTGTGSVSFK